MSISCLGLYHVSSSLACCVYFMLCSIVSLKCFIFLLSFIFSFILHPSCIIFYPYSYPFFFFSSFLLIHLSIHNKKGREYTKVYTKMFRHFYMTHVHILKGRNSTSCTFIGGESHRGDAYTKGEKTFFMRKPCFVLFYLMLVFLLIYGALSYF